MGLLKEKLEDLVLLLLPQVERSEVKLAEAFLTHSKGYDISSMSPLEEALMVLYFFDPGFVDLMDMVLGWYPLKGYEKGEGASGESELDPLYSDKTAASGGKAAAESSGGIPLGGIKSVVGSVLKIGAIGAVGVGATAGIGAAASGGDPVRAATAPFAAAGSLVGLGIDNVDDSAAGNDIAEDAAREADSVAQDSSIVRQVMCLASGDAAAGCVREQRDQRPGSKDVGEKYGLVIQNFQVGSGSSFDVSYDDPNTTIPLSFTIRNRMHGRKGIDARDVGFRIKMIDSERDADNPYCDTGWLALGQSDVDGDQGPEEAPDDLAKGEVAGTGFVQISEEYVEERLYSNRHSVVREIVDKRPASKRAMTLRNCEMLQPGQGQKRKIILELRYDYFSQARSTFQAMSQQYLRENRINRQFEPSKTANTPAKAVVSLREPVLFSVAGGERQPEPFSTKVTLETDSSDLRYRVTGLDLIRSASTRIARPGQCNFKQSGDSRVLELKERASNRMIFDQDPKNRDRPVSAYWNTEGDRPAIMGCPMELKPGQLDGISASGETLAMRARTNYTIVKEEPMDSFTVKATSACDQLECPRLATLNLENATGYNFRTTCKGVDAGYQGCSAIGSKEGSIEAFSASDPMRNAPFDSVVEEGEVAVNLEKAFPDYSPKGSFDPIAGFDRDEWEKVDPDMDGVPASTASRYRVLGLVLPSGEREVKLQFIDSDQCGESPSVSTEGADVRTILDNCSPEESQQDSEPLAQKDGYKVVDVTAGDYAPGESFEVSITVRSKQKNLGDGSHEIQIIRKRSGDGAQGDVKYGTVTGSLTECKGSEKSCTTTGNIGTTQYVNWVDVGVRIERATTGNGERVDRSGGSGTSTTEIKGVKRIKASDS